MKDVSKNCMVSHCSCVQDLSQNLWHCLGAKSIWNPPPQNLFNVIATVQTFMLICMFPVSLFAMMASFSGFSLKCCKENRCKHFWLQTSSDNTSSCGVFGSLWLPAYFFSFNRSNIVIVIFKLKVPPVNYLSYGFRRTGEVWNPRINKSKRSAHLLSALEKCHLNVLCRCAGLFNVLTQYNKLTMQRDIEAATKERNHHCLGVWVENFVHLLWTTCWILNNWIARCQKQSSEQFMTMSSSNRRFILSAG